MLVQNCDSLWRQEGREGGKEKPDRENERGDWCTVFFGSSCNYIFYSTQHCLLLLQWQKKKETGALAATFQTPSKRNERSFMIASQAQTNIAQNTKLHNKRHKCTSTFIIASCRNKRQLQPQRQQAHTRSRKFILANRHGAKPAKALFGYWESCRRRRKEEEKRWR